MTQLARIGAARLQIAQQFTPYGSRWTVTDPDGTARGSVVLYVRQISERVPSLAGTGFTTDTRWVGYGPRASAATTAQAAGIWPGRVLTQGAVRFYVQDAPDLTRGITEVAVDPNV